MSVDYLISSLHVDILTKMYDVQQLHARLDMLV